MDFSNSAELLPHQSSALQILAEEGILSTDLDLLKSEEMLGTVFVIYLPIIFCEVPVQLFCSSLIFIGVTSYKSGCEFGCESVAKCVNSKYVLLYYLINIILKVRQF